MCIAVLVFFALTSWLGPMVAASVAVVVGFLAGVFLKVCRGAGTALQPGVLTADGCRFIPLDADDISAALVLGPWEKAPEGAIPPRLPEAVAAAARAAARAERAAQLEAAPLSPGTVRATGSTLRLAGRPASTAAAPRLGLPGSIARVPAPVPVPLPPASTPESAPDKRACPQCGSELELRLAMEGPAAGRFLWGCRSFPTCRYVDASAPVGRNGVPASN